MRPDLFNVRNAPFIESLTHPLAQPGDGLRIRNRFPSKSYSASHNAFPFADSPFGTGMFSHQESVGDVGEGVCSASRSLMYLFQPGHQPVCQRQMWASSDFGFLSA